MNLTLIHSKMNLTQPARKIGSSALFLPQCALIGWIKEKRLLITSAEKHFVASSTSASLWLWCIFLYSQMLLSRLRWYNFPLARWHIMLTRKIRYRDVEKSIEISELWPYHENIMIKGGAVEWKSTGNIF